MQTLRKKDLITTQMPLPKTVEDFYKLVAAEKCHVIIMLNSTKTMDKVNFISCENSMWYIYEFTFC